MSELIVSRQQRVLLLTLNRPAARPDELAAGYVLSCQALPLTSDVVVDLTRRGA
ncbi:hypothetical protein [Escherichia coli]|uniref:hypothetical protein n=1 Tax=Escherichia coli TaxID=562 RepID=UPI001F0EA3C5|nr:hypothetical protein [Escherichia coli]